MKRAIAWAAGLLGLGIAGLVGWVVLGIALLSGCPASRNDIVRSARSAAFAELHSRVVVCPFKNVTVLPEAAFIVVDGTVINAGQHTYGEAPVGMLYEDYYQQGSRNRFDSLPALLQQRGLRITEDNLSDITHRMKSLGIGDIAKNSDNGIVSYSWNMSAIWGASGVLFAPSPEALDTIRKEGYVLEPIHDGFYYWAAGG